MLNDILIDKEKHIFIDLELCEFSDMTLAKKRSQDMINEQILNSDYALFIVKNIYGKYTKEEFIFACEHKENDRHTHIEFYMFEETPEQIKEDILKDNQNYKVKTHVTKNAKSLIYEMIKSLNQTLGFKVIELLDDSIHLDDKHLKF